MDHRRGTAPFFVREFLPAWQLGPSPHRHTFYQVLPSTEDRGSAPASNNLGRPFRALCSTCDQTLTITCTNPGLNHPSHRSGSTVSTGCSEGPTHHFHWATEPLASTSTSAISPSTTTTVPSQPGLPHAITVSCCQCAFSATVQLALPIIPTSVLTALERSRVESTNPDHPQALASEAAQHLGRCLEIFLIYISDALRGNGRAINTKNKSFRERVGLHPASLALFEAMGFELRATHLYPPELNDTARADLQRAQEQLAVHVDQLHRRLHHGAEHSKYPCSEAKVALQKALGVASYPKKSGGGGGGSSGQSADGDPLTCYTTLGCVNDMDDTVLNWAYRILIQEDPAGIPRYLDALYDLSLARSSDLLRTIIESERIAHHYTATDIQNAYKFFGADATKISDYELACQYRTILQEEPQRADHAFAQMQILAASRSSLPLEKFLQVGGDAAFDELIRELDGHRTVPAGLENIGNTCYLNSLLQYYFTILPLRAAVLGNEALWNTERELGHRDGKRPVVAQEVDNSLSFVDRLRDLFQNLQDTAQPAIRPDRELARQSLTNVREEMSQTNSTQSPPSDPVFGPATAPIPTPAPLSPTAKDSADGSPSSIHASPGLSEAESDSMDVDPTEQPNTVAQENSHSESSLAMESDDEGSSQKRVRFTVQPESVSEPIPATTEQQAPEAPITRPPPPPLPARPTKVLITTPASNQMLFGRQQDVTECMENIMYVLETGLKPGVYEVPLIPVDSKEDPGDQKDSAANFTQADPSQGTPPDPAKPEPEFTLEPHEDPRKPDANLIRRLFFGVTDQSLSYHDPRTDRTVHTTKPELFSHLIIQAEMGQDLYGGLDTYFGQSQVAYAGTQATREVYADHLPQFLQIQIQRVQFDVQRGRVYKNNAYIAFEPVIYLDRYLAERQAALTDRKDRVAELKQRIQDATEAIDRILKQPGTSTEVPDMLKTTISYLKAERERLASPPVIASSYGFSELAPLVDISEPDQTGTGQAEIPNLGAHEFDDPIANLELVYESLETQRRDHESRRTTWETELKDVFKDLTDVPYRAHAVFMHRGEASYGHYWIYIRDHVHERWYKYNDSTVTPVDAAQEVFADTTGSNANPYLIVYVRDDRLTELTQSVA
ncbi:hypothetical protein BJ085DRAFT_32885 [Dimargaris cristalligena]|uniref:ubiquitinyl hydrolase 1 n=1 Tax=Dimargaris cristalligena TaxID=215637 RepID=A0A4P9ZW02_9FUNG|nr:hypothetical protein BJ085DRAFT_32885 [Dimargaris cristalligena]|eukprot:RKP37804.1 hypothetical protein BJ085DRAFT_32885 [Dimargaris cristalligena]